MNKWPWPALFKVGQDDDLDLQTYKLEFLRNFQQLLSNHDDENNSDFDDDDENNIKFEPPEISVDEGIENIKFEIEDLIDREAENADNHLEATFDWLRFIN